MDVLVNLDVDDLEKAVRFYAAAFDLRPARRFGPHAIEIAWGIRSFLSAREGGRHASHSGK